MLRKIFIVLGFSLSMLSAQMHSLVIGVNGDTLIGAENDAFAMHTLLKQKGVQFQQAFYGKDATAKNIMDAFEKIVKNAKPNDWVYLFFSGHGTSPFDPANNNKPHFRERLKGTGAIYTADNKYLVIKETFAPLFKTLDTRGVKTIVIFDACFSGSAYKNSLNGAYNFPFYTPKPTQRSVYPYKNLIYLSSTTYSDFASESQKDRRGYFSLAITHCLGHHHTGKGIKGCLDKVKHQWKKLPQTPVILPHREFSVFPSYHKDIIAQPNYNSLKKELLGLSNKTQAFQLYAENRQSKTVQSYAKNESLNIHLKSQHAGYFVLFSMGESKTLRLEYPNAKVMPYIPDTTHKKLFTIKAKAPFGEELFAAYLVDTETAQKLQRLHKETEGNLSDALNIAKAIELVKAGQIVGHQLTLTSHKN